MRNDNFYYLHFSYHFHSVPFSTSNMTKCHCILYYSWKFWLLKSPGSHGFFVKKIWKKFVWLNSQNKSNSWLFPLKMMFMETWHDYLEKLRPMYHLSPRTVKITAVGGLSERKVIYNLHFISFLLQTSFRLTHWQNRRNISKARWMWKRMELWRLDSQHWECQGGQEEAPIRKRARKSHWKSTPNLVMVASKEEVPKI